MTTNKIKLSVLDQSPIRKGGTATEALQETTQLAQLTDKLGYTRFWVSEHHNTRALAGSAPEILIAHLANHTTNIRVGSGGIMLPNHSALKMAENFKLLEALFPNRIDMGIGRAPGTDRLTASLLNPSNQFNPQDFINQLYDLENFFHDADGAGTVYQKVKAEPHISTVPSQWLLTSSGESAMFAAHFGMAVSFAHFINPVGGRDAVEEYRAEFEPSADLKYPKANVAVFAFCNEDEEKAHRQQALMDYRFIQLETGGSLAPITYDEIKDISYSNYEKQRIEVNRRRTISGTPEQVKPKIEALAAHYGVDEVMLVTYTETIEDKMHSYELFAEMFGL
ncbi:LLM class flavin-dependent oxidoreductase [Dysgonomonas sp. ZJ709]|uniref:LLM class flavin-dependent oxidoreductase n=1 Tax=Dysgonomonas sp. ZJ709 TaxID=2709797 RepID=UPI0013E9C5C6|nr:LLM class flavin-dependent oxidoreductase [Dysgonomonas sp. ZJ709]